MVWINSEDRVKEKLFFPLGEIQQFDVHYNKFHEGEQILCLVDPIFGIEIMMASV